MAKTTRSAAKPAAKITKPVTKPAEVETAALLDAEAVVDGEVIGGVTETTADEAPLQTTGETVVICSNFPRDLKIMVPDNHGHQVPIVIKGNAVNLRGKDKGIIPIGGYGVTTGVPKEAWEWIKKHRPDDEFIKQGLVFATTATQARAAAKERADLRHGFEPVDPKKTGKSQPYGK